jgi:hypothetical protein
VDSFVGASGNALTGNVDGINGSDNWLQIERVGGGIISATRNLTSNSLRRRTQIKIFNPLGSPVTHIRVAVSTDLVTIADSVFAVPANTETIELVEYELNKTNAQVAIVSCDAAGTAASVASGTIVYAKEIVQTPIGLTSELLASNAQSDTGQILDSSGNKNHALLPASGATVVGRPVSQTREVRWTNTWAGTNELQYIGGVNQAILPANAYIESIIGTVSGATPHDIIVGDNSDADRYVTITTGLAAGTTSFTLANRTTDGTNLKLTVDPDTDADMSIAWVISYRILE